MCFENIAKYMQYKNVNGTEMVFNAKLGSYNIEKCL